MNGTPFSGISEKEVFNPVYHRFLEINSYSFLSHLISLTSGIVFESGSLFFFFKQFPTF